MLSLLLPQWGSLEAGSGVPEFERTLVLVRTTYSNLKYLRIITYILLHVHS